MARTYNSGRPKLACEIAPDRVIAGRAADSGQVLELCSTSELTPGCVVPDLTESNLRQRNAVVSALQDALGNVGARTRDVVAVLPDKTRLTGAIGPRPRPGKISVTVEVDDLPATLEKARALIAEDKKADARKLIQEGLRKHPKSAAAAEARELLGQTR